MCEREIPRKNRGIERVLRSPLAHVRKALASQIARSQRRKTLRAPRIAAPSPLTHCRTRARASAAPNDARTQAKNKSSPKMIKKQVLITALALALHGAAGDDLCAPASTSAARRVYVGRASRAAHRAAHRVPAGPHRHRHRARRRPRRRRPRRPCRAGALQRRNSTLPSKPGTLQTGASLEQLWSRQRCASAALRPTSGPDNATALGRGPCDARLARGLPRSPQQHIAAHEQQS